MHYLNLLLFCVRGHNKKICVLLCLHVCLFHDTALQEKARAAKSKLADAEAKLAARQSRYALAEGGSITQR